MDTFYTVKVKHKVKGEKQTKIICDTFFVNALSVTEAESLMTEYAEPRLKEFIIQAVALSQITENFVKTNGGDKFYGFNLVTTTESDKGKSQDVTSYGIINGSDIHAASANLIEALKGTVSDCRVSKIQETKNIYDEDLTVRKKPDEIVKEESLY